MAPQFAIAAVQGFLLGLQELRGGDHMLAVLGDADGFLELVQLARGAQFKNLLGQLGRGAIDAGIGGFGFFFQLLVAGEGPADAALAVGER